MQVLTTASRLVTQALRLDPRDAGALEARAALRLWKGESHGALADLTAALASPSAPPYGTSLWKALHCEAAAVYAHMGNRHEAHRLYEKAAGCLSGSSSALLGLGTLALLQKKWAEAAVHFDAALTLGASDESRFALDDGQLVPAELLATATLPPGAAATAAAAAAAAAAPAAIDSGRGGGGLLAALGGKGAGKGKEVARDALSRLRAQRGRAALGAGVAYLCLRMIEPARSRFLEAIVLRGGCGRTQFNRGVFHLVANEPDAAEADLLNCVKLLPTNGEAWVRKSQAIVRQEATFGSGGGARKVQLLMDYANSLLIIDFAAEQKRKHKHAKAEAARDERRQKDKELDERWRQSQRAALDAHVDSMGGPPLPSALSFGTSGAMRQAIRGDEAGNQEGEHSFGTEALVHKYGPSPTTAGTAVLAQAMGGGPPGKQRLAVTMPPGLRPGEELLVQHAGQQYRFTVPAGLSTVTQCLIEVPRAPDRGATYAEIWQGRAETYLWTSQQVRASAEQPQDDAQDDAHAQDDAQEPAQDDAPAEPEAE